MPFTTESLNLKGTSKLSLDGTQIPDGSTFVQSGGDLVGTGGAGPGTNKTASYTALPTDHLITLDLVNTDATITLPTVPTTYCKEYVVALNATGTAKVTVAAATGQDLCTNATLYGSVDLDTAGQFVVLVSNMVDRWLVKSTGGSTLAFNA